MIDVKKILYELSQDKRIFESDIDLIKEGIMDSFFLIELINRLEDEGITIHVTQIDRNLLRTVEGIEKIVAGQGK
ncbi:hypothetical protein [Treponema sp.]|uniref:hypothetical protein n=1 Tax=Treponema sp. TaxID=166 RepID=UPI00298E47F9|nr:hypothetical protein [Treponema sp.]MCR5614396.1 hypothetical protein [Treponema sp.]